MYAYATHCGHNKCISIIQSTTQTSNEHAHTKRNKPDSWCWQLDQIRQMQLLSYSLSTTEYVNDNGNAVTTQTQGHQMPIL